MRLLLTTIWMVGSVLGTQAQDAAFNPYQATLDRMPIEEAEPLIIQYYGAVGQRSQGFGLVKDQSDTVMLQAEGTFKSYFVFCNGRLAAFSGPVTGELAASILNANDTAIYAGSDALTVSLNDEDLSITYWTGGDIGPRIELTYPTEPFRMFDSSVLCESLED
ncbi:MAG: hypothetical protein KKF33_11125 [Alphaproteobacteria bacterium]|nr:hypothetical protein [Alphaproteobacteria bacterium]